MNPYYEVIYPKVDKRKLIELAHMIAGTPVPTIRKPVLRLRPLSSNPNVNESRNIYGNDTNSWRTLAASSSGLTPGPIQSPGSIAAQKRKERETKTALRELGKMVRGF